jgi:hypothetical protein
MSVANVLLSSVLLLCVTVGCVSAGDDQGQSAAPPGRDSWYSEPKTSESLRLNGGKLISEDRVFEVDGGHEAEAEKMLESVSVTQINEETAKHMVGDRFHSVEGFTPFLARGLYYSKGTGRWRIYELRDKLEVAHFCLGNQKMVMHRQAVVLFLKSKPAEVYTFCGGAQ